jgi:U3 small nucleolar RNA-associated protein MPP10
MEEITPVHVSDAQTLAPQEVYESTKNMLGFKSQEELSKEDKLKLRRKAKSKLRKEKQRRAKDMKLIQKVNPGLGNKYAKDKAVAELKKQSNVTVIGAHGDLNRGGKIVTSLKESADDSQKQGSKGRQLKL